MAESHWQDAVVRQLQVIGEATKRLSPDFRASMPTVDWRRIAGLRDVLVHDYADVDLANIWVYANEEVPNLKRAVTDILTLPPPPS